MLIVVTDLLLVLPGDKTDDPASFVSLATFVLTVLLHVSVVGDDRRD